MHMRDRNTAPGCRPEPEPQATECKCAAARLSSSNAMTDVPTTLAWDTLIDVSEAGGQPLHQRLAGALRAAIETGRLTPGMALPPTRLLADELHCSRWAVTEAYEQLTAEGFLEARVGSGTRVRASASAGSAETPSEPAGERSSTFDLRPGLPDLSAFPAREWVGAIRAVAARIGPDDIGEPQWGGHPRLLRVLNEYLARVRGAMTGEASVRITNGIADAVGLTAAVLKRDGFQAIAVEDPCWRRLPRVIEASGLAAVPVGVDDDGLNVDELTGRGGVRAVLISPCHQYPTGVALSAQRRRALLEWARRVDGVVLEDDYDSEFRYDRPPTVALQASEPGRVFLFGSLSKTLSPAMRMGWMLCPRRWSDEFRGDRVAPYTPPTLDQLAFATMLQSGAYDRHLRRLRLRYRRRRRLLLDLVTAHLPDVRVSGAAAGLHLLLHLPTHVDAARFARRVREAGIGTETLSSFRAAGVSAENALVIGYGNVADAELPDVVLTLSRLLRAG